MKYKQPPTNLRPMFTPKMTFPCPHSALILHPRIVNHFFYHKLSTISSILSFHFYSLYHHYILKYLMETPVPDLSLPFVHLHIAILSLLLSFCVWVLSGSLCLHPPKKYRGPLHLL